MSVVPDKDNLKKTYNENYQKAVDLWSDNKIKRTDRIIGRIIRYLITKGFIVDSSKKSLDVGCAKGYYTESLRKFGLNSSGFDYSETAINIAQSQFPGCNFFIMDGFSPELKEKYDLIFMKGFSGTNTHNLDFVVKMSNAYIKALNEGGWFILAYSTNYSGFEVANETANWNKKEIEYIANSFKQVKFVEIKYFSYSRFWRLIRYIMNLLCIKRKSFFYMMFTRIS
jgi:SAM-dependent methyltransferase